MPREALFIPWEALFIGLSLFFSQGKLVREVNGSWSDSEDYASEDEGAPIPLPYRPPVQNKKQESESRLDFLLDNRCVLY